jgi:hypothetical protein
MIRVFKKGGESSLLDPSKKHKVSMSGSSFVINKNTAKYEKIIMPLDKPIDGFVLDNLFDFKAKKGRILHTANKGDKIAFKKDGIYVEHTMFDRLTLIPYSTENVREEIDNEVVEDIIDIFDVIAKPFMEDEIETKTEVMLQLIESYGYEATRVDKIGIVIKAKAKKIKHILISHMDLIPLFHKGFIQGNKLDVIDGEVIGAHDNTMTNAVILKLLKDKLIDDNIEILFSFGEEKGMHGVRNYFLKNKKHKDVGVINLDVTNEAYGKSAISFEYDKPNSESFLKLVDFTNDFSGKICFDRVCDDIDAVHESKSNGLSVCLPVDGTIHSYKSKCPIEDIEDYTNVLCELLRTDINFGLEPDMSIGFNSPSAKKASKMTQEELLEAFKKRSYVSSYGHKTHSTVSRVQKKFIDYGNGFESFRDEYDDSDITFFNQDNDDFDEDVSIMGSYEDGLAEIEVEYLAIFSNAIDNVIEYEQNYFNYREVCAMFLLINKSQPFTWDEMRDYFAEEGFFIDDTFNELATFEEFCQALDTYLILKENKGSVYFAQNILELLNRVDALS